MRKVRALAPASFFPSLTEKRFGMPDQSEEERASLLAAVDVCSAALAASRVDTRT